MAGLFARRTEDIPEDGEICFLLRSVGAAAAEHGVAVFRGDRTSFFEKVHDGGHERGGVPPFGALFFLGHAVEFAEGQGIGVDADDACELPDEGFNFCSAESILRSKSGSCTRSIRCFSCAVRKRLAALRTRVMA